EPHDRRAYRLSEGAAVHERGVVERREPLEVIVDRMVDAATALTAEAEVQGRDPDVLQEGREVRAGTERVDAQVGALPRFLTQLGRARGRAGAELGPLPGGEPGLGIFDVSRHGVDEGLERVRATGVQVPAAVGL